MISSIKANKDNFYIVLNEIGKLHTNNYEKLSSIKIVDDGLTIEQKNELNNIKKIEFVDNIETNVNLDNQVDFSTLKKHLNNIHRIYKISVITAIGKMDTYKKFIPTYFTNIQQQDMFEEIEFLIVYSEWDSIFDEYTHLKNVRFIQESKPINMYYAWNDGIKNATSEYITNWNIDDIRVNQNNLLKYELLRDNVDIDMTYNYHTLIAEKDLENLTLEGKKPQPVLDEFHKYVTKFCMGGPDPMWRKSTHLVCGLFDYENYSIIADWEMWIRMASKGFKFKLIPYILCLYVNHDKTVSKSSKEKVKQQEQLLRTQYKF